MTEENALHNDPEFEVMARRTVREYEARHRRRGDDSGASSDVTSSVEPHSPMGRAGNSRPLPETDQPAP